MSKNPLSVVRPALPVTDDLLIDEMTWTGNDLDNVVTLCYCGSYRSGDLDDWLGRPAAEDDRIAA